jgi:flagellar biosynthesis regulator FlaF
LGKRPKESLQFRYQELTGEVLAPLSRRDIWILTRVVGLMIAAQASDPHDDIYDPMRLRYYRTTLDWLRVPTDDGDPHWLHTQMIEEAEMDESSAYTSDEDDRYTSD